VILIDTHILLWWITGESQRLSGHARRAIDAELDGGTILVSSASAWEIAVLAAKGRIGLTTGAMEWLADVESIGPVRFVPVDNEIAIMSTQLGDGFHKDPADRFIVATCQKLGVPLVTADKQIRDFKPAQTIW